MTSISVQGLTIRFPIHGADSRSLKKHLARVTVGGRLGTRASGTTIVTALQNVHLQLKAGDRLGIIGPNGSGKTTLLRTLAGAYSPDEGRVEVHGRIASLLDLGLGIDPSATGLENIRLRGMVAGLRSREIEAKLPEIEAFSGLGPFLALPFKTYSAGMTARLAFAVATSVDADILLMDEWIAVGDAEFRDAAHERLLELVAKARILVIASHSEEVIRAHCNKIMHIDHGRSSEVMGIEAYDSLMHGSAAVAAQ